MAYLPVLEHVGWWTGRLACNNRSRRLMPVVRDDWDSIHMGLSMNGGTH